MPFRNILINTAFPYASDDVAVQVGADLASEDGQITLFDVSSDLSWAMQHLAGNWENTIEAITGSKRKSLTKLAETVAETGQNATAVLAEGRLSRAIMAQVESREHDLVVKVAEPSSRNRSGFIGSTDMRLIHECPCPVLILKPDEQSGFQKVAVAVDVLDQNDQQRALDEKAVQFAAELVDSADGSLNFIYSLPPMQAAITILEADKDVVSREQLEQWDVQLGTAAKCALENLRTDVAAGVCAVLHGRPETAIPEFVNTHGIDLLVMGSVARKGLEGFIIGNTAERMLERVSCSVLVLKPTQPCSRMPS